MLSSQTNPSSAHGSLSHRFDTDSLGDCPGVAAGERRSRNPPSSSSSQHPGLTSTDRSSSSPTSSPGTSSRLSLIESFDVQIPERCFSQLTITTSQDESSRIFHSVSYERSPSITLKREVDMEPHQHRPSLKHQRSSDFTQQTSSPLPHPRRFSFTIVSSPDGADVIPKIEEIEDCGSLSAVEEFEQPDTTDVRTSHQSQPDLTNGENDTPGPPVPQKRKRGRPRKHPLPVPGQVKVTKGRSKTGCITCRRRKKKCDETKPCCLNCQKNAVVCEGYPVKEIWKSGKQKMEEAARKASLATLPRGLPLLIDGIETEIDRRFLDHFVYDFSRVLTLINDDSNPFKEILLPMATQHRGLMHALMCLSGSHLSARDPEPALKERKHYHFSRAIADLRSTIAARSESSDPDSPVDDPTIASTIALCLNTICEGETQGEYRSHMDAARYFLATQRPRNEKFRQFIVEFFQYHDVSNSLTTLDRRPICLTGDFRLPDFVPHAQAGALLGIFDGLFHYISQITVIRDKIRQRINQGIEPGLDYESLSNAVFIDSCIRAWEPIYPPDDSNWFAAQLYRQSTWVYLYRTISPSRPSEKISRVVDDGLLYLEQLPRNAGAYSILLMPLFLLGCSAFEERQRERIKQAFDDLKAYSNLRNIEPALTIVERVWQVMDTNPDQSWDWEKIINDLGMDFLIT
ncbi:hypothetical protein VTO42DRAFT_927 [Malbranchea cinnamomea]